MSDLEHRSQAGNGSIRSALEQTRPQAEVAFRENLEAQLMTRITKHTSDEALEDNTMTNFNQQKPKRSNRSSRVPITLVAAIIAIALVGGLIVLLRGSTVPTAGPSDCTYNGEFLIHMVRPGENLLTFSDMFNVSVDDIRRTNCMPQDQVELAVNSVIKIPLDSSTDVFDCDYAGNTDTIVLEDGDTLFDIAERYEVTVEELLAANCFEDQLILEVGDEVQIPVTVPGQIPTPRTIYIAKDDIKQGDPISSALFEQESRMPDSLEGRGHISNLNDISGMVAAIDISRGTILDESMITSGQLIPVVVSVSDISAGSTITEDDLQVILYPISYVPGDTYMSTDFIVGKIAQRDIHTYETVFASNIGDAIPAGDVSQSERMPLVIARQNIALSDIITEDMITTVMVSADFMAQLQPPVSSFMDITGSPELVVGRIATTFIPQFAPVRLSSTTDDATCASNAGDERNCVTLEQGKVAVALPVEDRSVMLLTEGQRVDILAAILTVPVDAAADTDPEPTLMTGATDATLLQIKREGDDLIVLVAVSTQDAEVLTYLAETGAAMRLVPYVEGDEPVMPSERGDLPAGIEIVDVISRGTVSSESVRLRNIGTLVNVEGWTLEDSDGNIFTFGYLNVFAGSEHRIATGRGENSPHTSYWGLNARIYQSGETITLYDADGVKQSEYIIP